MPNGGYPKHLLLRLSDEFELYINGKDISLVHREPKPDSDWKMTWTTLGSLDSRQLQALLYHLSYWGGNTKHGEFVRIKYDDVWVAPQYGHGGCLYDY